MRAVPCGRCLLFFTIAAGGCAADLATKSWIFHWLGMPGQTENPWWLWRGVFGFQTSLNPGALFGLGQGWVSVFATLSIFALLGVLIWLFYGGALGNGQLTVALGAITGGILGNLYDRLGFPGLVDHSGGALHAVRDWILVMFGDYHWPNFNIADSLLVSGAILLVWHAFWHDESVSPPKPRGEA